MIDLTKLSITALKGIGEKKTSLFNKLGIFSIMDLLTYYPRKYEDRSEIKEISKIENGNRCCIKAMVASSPSSATIRGGLRIIKFRVVDHSGSAYITIFNQPYLNKIIHQGDYYCFYGTFEKLGSKIVLTNPVFEVYSNDNTSKTGRIVPIYKLCKGINSRIISDAIKTALSQYCDSIPDYLPNSVVETNSLCSKQFAIQNIHFPNSPDDLNQAKNRLIFEELFVLSSAFGMMRKDNEKPTGRVLANKDISAFISSLPYSPTRSQARVINDALLDMNSGKCMNRLLQGDVGSGKTIVAAALIYCVFLNGYSSAFMAPTEILAEQHYTNLCKMFTPFGMRIFKLTGNMSLHEKREIKRKLAAAEYDLVIGTHALITDDVKLGNLGFVVTDEQHRFGVQQRAKLSEKAENHPHLLVMSATPIPRTMALIMYGDLDISVIDELPPGRKKVESFLVDENYRERINSFIKKTALAGNQIYVVCPAIEENEESNLHLKSAVDYSAELSNSLPDLSIACLHGKLKANEKDAIMQDFKCGNIDVLVSTTVIEVGVDIPTASLMVIENAERFGLSQLHQLRGRVGRGADKSYCVLFSDNKNTDVQKRLSFFSKTTDGFVIAEEDLKLRGPGDFFGSRQHGLPETHIADLITDIDILKAAHEQSQELLKKDPLLLSSENINLKARINELFTLNRETFN